MFILSEKVCSHKLHTLILLLYKHRSVLNLAGALTLERNGFLMRNVIY